nr:hypothetical protein [Candidatus Sumerlaeota bacterium]
EEWEPVGDNSTLRTYRDGVLLREITIPGLWNPTGHSIRIGASPRSPLYDDFGAPPNAVFSRIRVYSVACAPPAAPTLTAPAANETLPSATVGALWEGDAHSHVQLRITREPDLDSELLWDSGLLESPNDWIWSGKLPQQTPAYAAVRLGNLCGVGPWSEPVGPFNLDRGYEPQEADTVRLVGAVLVDNQGPFLGLGASYFQAMRRCKYDRDRFESDLSFLAANEFRYIRILSMVGWYEAWQGLEIAPVSFNNRANVPVAAWEDYWQQFRDCIDIAYEHGLRTEVTIFADAQMMPDKADRIAHMDTMLENLVGREHKVILLEVGNEAWQNGFSGAQGRADLREFGQYLAERTEIPVALSAPDDISDAGINLLYSGSAADIATVHFTRDLAPDAGWAPVYDIYRTGLVDVPPMSSNEPIGPGASVNSENDPVKLVMAAVYAWAAGLPMYVFHCEAGVFGSSTFEGTPAIDAYDHLDDILPPDLSGWARNNGIMPDSPFITYCEGQPDTPWSAVPGANDGVIRNNGATNGCDFIALPIAVLADGVELEPRRPMALNVHHPLTGEIVDTKTLAAGERFTLPQGPGAWILRGRYLDCAVGTGVGDWTRY